MGDRTYGQLSIDNIPDRFTIEDHARLILLRAEFDAAGGRGVDLAEQVDALEDKSTRTQDVLRLLDNASWGIYDLKVEDPTSWATTDTQMFTQEEISCGYFDNDYDGLFAELERLGVSYHGWEDPHFEWLGCIRIYTPDLGLFTAECDSDGNVVIGADTLDSWLDHATSLDQLRADVARLTGRAWRTNPTEAA